MSTTFSNSEGGDLWCPNCQQMVRPKDSTNSSQYVSNLLGLVLILGVMALAYSGLRGIGISLFEAPGWWVPVALVYRITVWKSDLVVACPICGTRKLRSASPPAEA